MSPESLSTYSLPRGVSPIIMFLVMRNRAILETQVIADALRSIAALLPASWRLESLAGATAAEREVDAVKLTGPDRTSVKFVVEAKRSGTSSRLLLARLRELSLSSDLPLLFVSDYIGPSLREALTAEGISYADATGWVRLTSEVPLVLLTGQGAERSPRAGKTTAVVRLNGVAASRIIRALSTETVPLGVRDLAAIADVSPGSVSKLLPTLASEGIIDRDERGAVVAVRHRALIQRWARDYSFTKTNGSVRYFIAPRGLDRTLSRLSDVSMSVALTGSEAARRLLPEGATSVVPLRLLALYAETPDTVSEELGLIPAELASANVVAAVPQDGRVLSNVVAPLALVLADLLTLPGRGDAEAEQLMDALARTDEAWEA